MRLSYLKSKTVSFFLIFVFLLQSCTIYKKSTINDAIETNDKVLVITTIDSIFRFKRIEQAEGVYYGFQRVDWKIVKVPLTQKEIKEIRIKDKTASTFLTIGVIIIPIIIGGIIIDNSLKDAFDWSYTPTNN